MRHRLSTLERLTGLRGGPVRSADVVPSSSRLALLDLPRSESGLGPVVIGHVTKAVRCQGSDRSAGVELIGVFNSDDGQPAPIHIGEAREAVLRSAEELGRVEAESRLVVGDFGRSGGWGQARVKHRR
jgi:hypothetical protein